MSLSGAYSLLLRGLERISDPRTLHYVSRDAAYEELKNRTGEDFGYDVEKWREHLPSHRERLGIASFDHV
jgi:hypothetical protein